MIDSIFIYPTDTVWGIGASIDSKLANMQIATIKGTDASKPLSVLFNSIEQLRRYIRLPEQMEDQWLKIFFSFESTLAVPRHLADGKIPEWILGQSDLVAIRCLELNGVSKIIEKVKTPITSTSFNLTGSPPLQRRDDAFELFQKIASSHSFVDDSLAPLSGNSSSILQLKENNEFFFLRQGSCAKQLLEHVHLLST